MIHGIGMRNGVDTRGLKRDWFLHYNDEWRSFFNANKSPTSQQMLSFARYLANRYALPDLPFS
jgi:hypothetical protein